MKLTKALLLMIAASFIFACNSGSQSKDGGKEVDKKEETKATENEKSAAPLCEIESGTIKYKVTSKEATMGQDMDLTIYFKDYARQLVNITEFSVAGVKMTQIMLIKDGYVYMYDTVTKKGAKSKLVEGESGSHMFVVNEDMLKSEGSKKIGNETILGKECTVYETVNDKDNAVVKVAVWKSLVLKMNVSEEGVSIGDYKALEVKETSDFPDGIFDVPSDVEITDADAIQKSFDDKSQKASKDNGGDFDEEGAKG